MHSKMRSALAVLAVLIGAFGVLGVAGAAPASAANCSYAISTTYWNATYGAWSEQTQLQSCTGVDVVEYSRSANGGASPLLGTGWVDQSTSPTATWHRAPSGAYNNVDDYLSGRYGLNLVNGGVQTWTTAPWCAAAGHAPGSAFVAYGFFTYRIHNITANQATWGPWHTSLSSNYIIGC